MGKLILLLVLGMTLAGGYTIYSMNQTTLQTDMKTASHEESVLAREIAISAYNEGISEVRRDFANWRETYTDRPYQQGTYDLAATGPAEGPVTITAVGRFGSAEHRLEGTFVETVDDFDAITLEAIVAEAVATDDSFFISGNDNNPPSVNTTTTYGPDAHAIRVTTEESHSALVSTLPSEQVYGAGGEGDVLLEQTSLDLEALSDDARSNADYTYDDVITVITNQTLGSSSYPVNVAVQGNLILSEDASGYGTLVVTDGMLIMNENANWEGLVILEQGVESVTLADESSVYGSVIARSPISIEEEVGEETCEGDFVDPHDGENGAQGTYPHPRQRNKSIICHIPPGNPDNAHTITISNSALQTHYSHHNDYDGECLPPDEYEEAISCTSDGNILLTMSGNSRVQYSSRAIVRLKDKIPAVKKKVKVVQTSKQ